MYALRKERRWSQARLAAEATPRHRTSEASEGIADRTVRAIERQAKNSSGWTRPRQETVAALAAAFGLEEGSSTYRAFLLAAASTRQAIDEPGSVDTIGTAEHHFVHTGREPHLARIARAIDDTAMGASQALFITAEAGTGKTWLIGEACRQAIGRSEQLVVLWGTCQKRSGIADPYQPFRQILRLMVGDTRSIPPAHLIGEENLDRIQSRIPTALVALDEVGRDLLHRLLPIDALNNARMREVADSRAVNLAEHLALQPIHRQAHDPAPSMHRLLQAYAGDGRVVLVLEDLHCSDGPTLELLASLLQRSQETTAPIVILASFRPVSAAPDEGSGPPLAAWLNHSSAPGAGSIVDLSTALTEEAGKRFITALAAEMNIDLDAEEVDRIQQQTLGLPIFVKGMLRQSRTSGAMERSNAPADVDSRWAVFDAEFDALSQLARRALLAASVQGTHVSLEILAQALDITVEQLTPVLNETALRRMGVLQPGTTPVGDDRQDSHLQFAHVMLRDRLYEACLTDIERAHWHLRTAEALAHAGSDESDPDHLGQVAFHLEQAGEPVAAAEAWLKMATMLIAHSQLDRAESILHRMREQNLRRLAPVLEAEALLGLANCAHSLDRSEEATRWLELGLDLVRRRRLRTLEARMLSMLGMIAYDAGQVHRGVELQRSAIAIIEETGNLADAASSLTGLSHNLHGLGLYDAAVSEAQRGLDLALQIHNEKLECAASVALANCWLDLGRFEAALDLYTSTLGICDRRADFHYANICLINISLCRIEQEEWSDAARALAPLMEQSRPIVPRFVAVVEFQAGLIAEGQGNWIAAQRHFHAAMGIRQRNGQAALLIDTLAGLLRVATAQRDTNQVRRLLADIDVRVAQHGLDGIEHAARVCLSMMEGGELVGDRSLTIHYAELGSAFLKARAAAILSPADRHSYLERVPSHRKLRIRVPVVLKHLDGDHWASVAGD